MAESISTYLDRRLAGEDFLTVGQVRVRKHGTEFELRHEEDSGVLPEPYTQPKDARQIALHNSGGQYRPLKSAPDLIRGWSLRLTTIAQVREALDYLYPAAIGNWTAWLREDAVPTPLRDTLNRQTGLYRITSQITDAEADSLVNRFCHPGCIKRILWGRTSTQPVSGLPEPKRAPDRSEIPNQIPLLCYEACCLLIAEARNVVKSRPGEAKP